MAEDIYKDSWQLYKAHTESFCDDIEFYSKFIGHNKALELFAGFGRVTNRLLELGHDLETVEINASFAKFINLSLEKNHITDVLIFESGYKFKRIFAAYNSFCLFADEADIEKFFWRVGELLEVGGKIALNYYHPNYWSEAASSSFEFMGKKVDYLSSFNLSKRYTKRIGIWIDKFYIEDQLFEHKYTTRVYEYEKELLPYLKKNQLRLDDVVNNFNKSENEITEPGWIDFVLEKY